MINQIILLIILICINAFFAATEIAFISINDMKFKQKAKEKDKKAIEIMKILKTPSAFLATIQIGITLAGFLSSALASEAFAEKLAPVLHNIMPFISLSTFNAISIIVVTIVLSFFMLLFGELIPKRIAMKHDEYIVYKSINIIKFISIIAKPFVALLTSITDGVSKKFGVQEYEEEHITEEEIRMIINQGKEKGAIKRYEQNLINNVLGFNDKKVIEITILKENVVTLDINLTIDKTLLILKKEGYKYSRIPVYNDDENTIIGILYTKDLLRNIDKPDMIINKIIYEPLFVSSNDYVNVVFNKLKRNKKQIAVVLDNNKYMGIVSMENVLEEIVGDIVDEYGN